MAAAWTQWEGQLVNGIYPLRRFLNASDHSSVFLTESTTEGFLNAAIKLIAAPTAVDVQLWQWKTAATFTHPHLLRLLDSGQCEIDGRRLLFVVMEYAEETLSQVLPYRALAAEEVRELLVPTLDALAVLHRENWVQGQLKPSNLLVVNDQLKLAMDTLRPAGGSREEVIQLSLYDPPEAARGEISLATDIWALGVTLVEALTQHPPTWPQGHTQPASLPRNLPAEFTGIIQRCLSIDPADRPSVADLQMSTQPAAAVQVAPAPPPQPLAQAPTPTSESVMRAMPPHSYSASARYSSRGDSEQRSWVMPAVGAVLIALLVVWGGSKLFRGHSKPIDVAQQSPSQQVAAPAPNPTPAERPAATRPPAPSPAAPAARASNSSATANSARATNGSAAVVHEEIPKVSPGARQTIRGHVRVSIRVSVNKSGAVVRDTLESASSSKYFNRVASEAARKWRFATGDSDAAREWLLHFEFGREGTTVHVTRARS